MTEKSTAVPLNGAGVLLKILRSCGVEHVFGLPGETTLALYDAWEDFCDIKYHMCRDERNAVFMADGYAKASGKVGVCEGPSVGATHMVPGVVEAKAGAVPLVVMTSDVPLNTVTKNMLTSFDQTALFAGICKESLTVTKAGDMAHVMARAFRIASTGRPGPVHVRLPMDVLAAEAALPSYDEYLLLDDNMAKNARYGKCPSVRYGVCEDEIAVATAALGAAKRPVMICGQGALISEAFEEVKAIAQKFDMPVGTTINAKGIFGEAENLSLGVVGSRGGMSWNNAAVADADLVLFVGCSTDSALTDGWKSPSPGAKKTYLQIDISPAELGNNYPVIPVLGDAKLALDALCKALKPAKRSAWIKKINADKSAHYAKIAVFLKALGDKLHPISAMEVLNEMTTEDTFFAVDPGLSAVYSAAYLKFTAAGRRSAYNFAMGALGYAIPAAIGAVYGIKKIKETKKPPHVISLTGDGSFGFTVGELESATRLGSRVVFILLDNVTFGWIRGTAYAEKDGNICEGYDKFTNFVPIDYVKIADGFGMKGFRADTVSGFKKALSEALATDGPSFIAIPAMAQDKELPPVPRWAPCAQKKNMPELY